MRPSQVGHQRDLLDGHSQLLVFPEETVYVRKFAARGKPFSEAAAEWLLTKSNCANLGRGAMHNSLGGDRDYSALDFERLASAYRALVA